MWDESQEEEEEGTDGEQWAQEKWDLLTSLPAKALLSTAQLPAVLCAQNGVNLWLLCTEDCQYKSHAPRAVQVFFESEKGRRFCKARLTMN